jgi:hypothetical protein
MEFKKINWVGLVCAIAGATLLALSLLYAAPWWQVEIGDRVGQVQLSPLDYRANLVGAPIEIPLVWFLNLGSKLTILAFTIAMLIYSVSTQRPSSKKLLGFAYKKPIYMLVLFTGMLVASVFLVGNVLGAQIPLTGTTTLSLSAGGATANLPVSTSFTWVFWLAVATTVLAVASRVYEWKVLKTPSAPTTLETKTETKTEETKEETNLSPT